MRLAIGLSAALLLSLSLISCGRRADPLSPVLVVGADGLEWNVLEPLLKAGRLPHLASLIERGTAGRLATYDNSNWGTYSPVIWTTIATGKSPLKHGIRHFQHARGAAYTSASRIGKALWNIASDWGLTCQVSGWWVTWPAEEIRGQMVSSTAVTAQVGEIWKGSFLENVENQTYPPELRQEIDPLVRELLADPHRTETRLLELLPERPAGLSFDAVTSRLLQQTAWSFASDEFYVRVARELASRETADLTLVYVGGTDTVGHRFWGYREPAKYKYPLPGAGLFGLEGLIDRYYEGFDGWLGDLLKCFPPQTTVIVLSDHGMHAMYLDEPLEAGITGGHFDGPEGVLIAAGPGIRHERHTAANRPLLGSVQDVTPTVLYLLGIPLGADMDGDLLRGLLDPRLLESRSLATVETHDKGFRLPTSPRLDERLDRAFAKQFSDLGYFEGSPPQPSGRVGSQRK
ncbi:MAG: alkaline phosphatase family protein [Planctomycetota bacterium]